MLGNCEYSTKMSTGKRLAKRSIIGTRVVALGDDGKYYSGMIQAVKTPASFPENNNCINLTPNTRYTVRFDSKVAVGKKHSREYRDAELIGPGFRSIGGVRLLPGQRVFLTHNGREVSGEVKLHAPEHDELLVEIQPVGTEMPMELKKRLDEVRLLESRKSARLADVDTDFARLADMAGDRRRVSTTIDVPSHAISGSEPEFDPKIREDYPNGSNAGLARSRKRRPSNSGDFGYGGGEGRDDMMDECNAALVLMSLSCSPNSPRGGAWGGRSSVSPGGSSSSRGSWRSSTPSPPPASISLSDEGIAMDYHMDDDDMCHQPRKKKINRMVYECTWRGCGTRTFTWSSIEAHIRNSHLGPKKEDESDHEEEFYYTEREVSPPPPPPTMSHRDMCRPPHEDPDYQRQLVGSYRLLSTLHNQQNSVITQTAGPITIPSQTVIQHARAANSHSPKHMKMSPSYAPYPMSGSIAPTSPGRRRSDNKKCRKVYGMEHRELWCTQCKWKKACSRFGE